MGVWTTSPRTWAAAENVTATNLNAQLRDFQNGFGAFTSYTPSWTAATTNPAIGNGTLVGAYTQVNKTVLWRAAITMGSTTTYGSGTWYITMPVAVSSAYAIANFPIGTWAANPGGARSNGVVTVDATTSRAFFQVGGSSTVVTATTPGTFANTNVLLLSGMYEAA